MKTSPNVNKKPLPNHKGPKVNAVESSQEIQVKREVRDVCMPMELVYKALVKAGRVKGGQEKEEEMNREKHFCQYHEKTMDHSIQKCPEFLRLVQEKINEGEMKFCGKMEEQSVRVLLKEVPKSITIFYQGEVSRRQRQHLMFPPLDWS